MGDIDLLHVKHFGYDSIDNFYRDGRLDLKIPDIRVPTLFLNAVDDMLSTETDIPIDNIKRNPYTALIKTKFGGHNGFCETFFPKGCNYVCRIISEYIQIVLENKI